MKLVCLHDYEGGITKGKTYLGQIVVATDHKVWFIVYNEDNVWKAYDIDNFVPRAE